MSIDTLKEDLDQVVKAAPTGALVTGVDVAAFLTDNLLPLLQAFCGELSEQDACIEDLVSKSAEVLHTDSAAVFAGIIASGVAIAAELRTRAGNDRRLLAMIKEFGDLALEGKELLEDIVIPDDEDDDDDEEDEATPSGDAPDDIEKTAERAPAPWDAPKASE